MLTGGHAPWALSPRWLDWAASHAGAASGAGPAARTPPPPRAITVRAQQLSAPRSAASHLQVIPVYGTLAHRGGAVPGFARANPQHLSVHLRLADADPQISTIVLDVDCHGGSVHGVQELADVLWAIRQAGRTRVVAVANSMALCGGYWVASQAHELVITPSGMVGGIGVAVQHIDASALRERMGVKTEYIVAGKYKAEGYSDKLTDSYRAHLQQQVDTYGRAFVAAVARGRDVPVQMAAGEGFGQGRVRLAAEAVRMGMADRIGTLEATIRGLLRDRRGAPGGALQPIGMTRRAAP